MYVKVGSVTPYNGNKLIVSHLYRKICAKYIVHQRYLTLLISTSKFQLSMVVLKHLTKLMLKWFLAGALLDLTVNWPKCVVLFRTINEPNQQINLIKMMPRLNKILY